MKVDGRGGIFFQEHVNAALAQTLDPAIVALAATGNSKTIGETIGLLAYKCRVMCSHLRACHDNRSSEQDDHSLQDVFQLMGAGEQKFSAKRRKRDARLTREHPFVCFRGAPAEEED